MSESSPSSSSPRADGPVVNEIAPRVHNSGHWTIEGAFTSQFEQHIRAICDLPPGSTALAASSVSMDNLIGDEIHGWERLLADPRAHVHLYGKGEARPGRKMGHVTRLVLPMKIIGSFVSPYVRKVLGVHAPQGPRLRDRPDHALLRQ